MALNKSELEWLEDILVDYRNRCRPGRPWVMTTHLQKRVEEELLALYPPDEAADRRRTRAAGEAHRGFGRFE